MSYIAIGIVIGVIIAAIIAAGYIVAGTRHMAEVDEGDAFGGEYE